MAKATISAGLLAQIQHYVAYDAIGVTAVRGHEPGTRDAVVDFLRRLDISHIPSQGEAVFKNWLNRQTERLRVKLPGLSKARLWGVARKSVNLFLRGCLYNQYLRDEYHLDRITALLEIPLDSRVAKKLREKYVKDLREKWPGLKRLEPDYSDRLQSCAATWAKTMKLPARVFLDHQLFLPSGKT
jgi:hypothetical protein